MPISSTITLQQVVPADSIPSNTCPVRIPNIQIPANLGNLGVKLGQQTTVSDVVNKGIGCGNVQKENSHTTEDKIKGNTSNCFIEALNGNYEGEQKTGEYEESNSYISVKGNLKKHLSFWEKMIRGNETVCDIHKSDYKLPFLFLRNLKTILRLLKMRILQMSKLRKCLEQVL